MIKVFKFMNFRLISRPTNSDSYIIAPFMLIRQFVTHRVKVFCVNKEYTDLYQSMEQDSRNLNEPLANIQNSLGIFTAFSCDSIFFEVVKQ